jgi:hypothetical protein
VPAKIQREMPVGAAGSHVPDAARGVRVRLCHVDHPSCLRNEWTNDDEEGKGKYELRFCTSEAVDHIIEPWPGGGRRVTRRGSTASRAGENLACRPGYVGIVSPGDSQCASERIC